MKRSDRLFQLVQFLKARRRVTPAHRIAEEFGVSVRTVYRDIQDLVDTGLPIQGEAGVGYILDRKFDLPPIMFNADEIEAIALGISMVKNWTDDAFASSAAAALAKIETALPATLQAQIQEIAVFAVQSQMKRPWTVSFSAIRHCIRAKRKIVFDYIDVAGDFSSHTVRPLALVFFGPVWLVVSWCELRRAFRNFRLDRMSQLRTTTEHFVDEPGKTLAEYIAQASGEA